jgi:hypothetical protein
MEIKNNVVMANSADDLLSLFRDAVGAEKTWSSSAMSLDDELAAAGFKFPKFFHVYKLPLSKEHLNRESYRMWLFSMPESNIKKTETALNAKINISDSLRKELPRLKEGADSEISRLAAAIKRDNPSLRHIQTPDASKMIHLIRGASYGYPPENIEFWIKNYPNNDVLNEAVDAKRILKKKFGINFGLIRLTEQQGARLVSELEKQSKYKQKLLPDKKTDSLGIPDPTGFRRFMEERYHDF